MKPLLWLSNIFINTFGITQPTPENARRMAIFIGTLLAVLVAAFVVGALLLHASIHT